MEAKSEKKLKIIFFGSGKFSIPTLQLLHSAQNMEISAVITNQPEEQGRGKKLQNNIVHNEAIALGISEDIIFIPQTLKNNKEIEKIITHIAPDIIVVVAYGKIIPKYIIDAPKIDIINLHPSSLPRWRGAAPIERAIEAGDESLDICIMKVDEGLDTGDIILKAEYKINNKNAKSVVNEMSTQGAQLLLKAIKLLSSNTATYEKQTEEGLIYAKKIEKSELLLDFTQNAKTIYNKIRAFNDCGCCYFIYDNKRIKILEATLLEKSGPHAIIGFDPKTGNINLHDGVITPTIIQPEGKNPMDLQSFLRGLK